MDVSLAYWLGADAYFIEDDGTGYDRVTELYGVPKDKTYCWPIPISAPTPSPYRFREALGIPDGAEVVLAVGRMVPVKRMDLALEVAIQVAHRIPSCHAVIVGDGPELPSLVARRSELDPDVSRRIHLPGLLTRDQLGSAYREATIFISLQEHSVSGTNLRDALIHGMAVVAVRRAADSAVRSLVKDGDNGRLIDEEQIKSFPDVVAELLLSPDARERLSTRAATRAREEFETWDARVEREVRIMRSLL